MKLPTASINDVSLCVCLAQITKISGFGSHILHVKIARQLCVSSDGFRFVADFLRLIYTMSGGNRLAGGVISDERGHTSRIFLQAGASAKLRRSSVVGIILDPEFQSLIAPLSADEFALLQSQILSQGCLSPLVVWKTEDGQKILLDGHNRLEICTKHHRDFQTRNVSFPNRDKARLFILEHQAGRRNLTDDQRAIVWNDIREQRSRIAMQERAAAAANARHNPNHCSEVKTTPKQRTRAAVAEEARLPENKLKQAQKLKKYQPELHRKVLAGEITLRDTTQLVKTAKDDLRQRYSEKEFYNRVGRSLQNLYKHAHLDERLAELSRIKKTDWCPAAQGGFKLLLHKLSEVQEQTERHIRTFKRVLRANR